MKHTTYQRSFSRNVVILCLMAFGVSNDITAAGALSQLKALVAHEHVRRVSRAGQILLCFDLLQLARAEQDKFFVPPVSEHRIALQIDCGDLSKCSTLFLRWLAHFVSNLVLSPAIYHRLKNRAIDAGDSEVAGHHLLNAGFHVMNCCLLSVSLCRQMSDLLSRRYLQTTSLRDHYDLASRIEECPVCLGDESGDALVVPCVDPRHAICGSCYQRLVEGRECYRCIFCNRIVPIQVVVEENPSLCERVNRLEGIERWLLVMLFAMQVHILLFLMLDLTSMGGYSS